MESSKYSISEEAVPGYAYAFWSNLTIKSIEKRDLGGYQCSSSNALGLAFGAVRLQGESEIKRKEKKKGFCFALT